MWPFKKAPPTDNDVTLIPVGLDEGHSYVQTKGDHPDKYDFGNKDYSPQIGPELPPIKDQDAILIHWYRPPDNQNPQAWWNDANYDRIARGAQERFTTDLGSMTPGTHRAEVNPWIGQPQPLPRVTSEDSPSNYRFERPFDQNFERRFNGVHFSMASNRRTYPVNGMQPQRNFRNTFRLEPVSRDIENVDLATQETPSAVPAVYVSPATQPSSRWGL